MQSWTGPAVPTLPGTGPALRLYDTATGEVRATRPAADARMYVCGVTPYDAAHLGHALTFLAFDLVNRAWRDGGHRVHYVQNVTDVDDPLLERAERDGVEWTALGARETQLLREDMTALRVLPPDDFVGAVEAIPQIVERVRGLIDIGAAYWIDHDVYFSVDADLRFGYESSLDAAAMETLFAENGGDPDRPGKKNPLDPLMWRGRREAEPSWDSPLGPGRPGWHIECAAIALERLGMTFDVQGGGSDLIFPHHEMSAAHAETLTGGWPFARHYVHVGMVGLDGEKMSKSRGNLVFVHVLREQAEPAAIRLALLDRHYRAEQDWTGERLETATARIAGWRAAVERPCGPSGAEVLAGVRARLAADLDTPGALSIVDRWAAGSGDDREAGGLVADTVDALLGLPLR